MTYFANRVAALEAITSTVPDLPAAWEPGDSPGGDPYIVILLPGDEYLIVWLSESDADAAPTSGGVDRVDPNGNAYRTAALPDLTDSAAVAATIRDLATNEGR